MNGPSSPRWNVPEAEIEFRFTASGGPGGQHANRAMTKVEALFRVSASPSMPPSLQRRVQQRLGDVVRVTVSDERSQLRNREIAVERLRAKVAAAQEVERTRRSTRPTRGSQERRHQAKRQRSQVKRWRRRPGDDD